MLSIDTLITAVTEDEAKKRLYDFANALGLKTTNWLTGGVTRTLIAIAAKLIASQSEVAVTVTKGGFLDDSTGPWLTLLGKLVYGVGRIEATYASGGITIVNSTGNIYSYDPGDFIVQNPTTKATYENTATLNIGASATVTDAPFRAQLIGSDGNATATQISDLVTSATGLTVNNAASFDALDEEEDPALRVRCRASLGALSPNGPKRAYEYVATTPDLVGGASVNRVKVLQPTGNGEVTVLLAGPSGGVIPADVALVQTGLDTWATPEVATVTAVSAVEKGLTYTGKVFVDDAAGLLDSEWKDIIRDALVAWSKAIPIGGVTLPPATSGSVLWRVRTGIIENIQIGDEKYVIQATLEETDVPMLDTEVAEYLNPAVDIDPVIEQVTV